MFDGFVKMLWQIKQSSSKSFTWTLFFERKPDIVIFENGLLPNKAKPWFCPEVQRYEQEKQLVFVQAFSKLNKVSI